MTGLLLADLPVMRTILIPVKDDAQAKTRLSEVLSFDERRLLVWAMLEDVGSAVVGSTGADRIVVVTSAHRAARYARSQGWDVLVEETQSSESASVDRASAELTAQGTASLMRLPADVPLIRSEDVTDLMAVELNAPAALLVPSRDGTGTNAIIRMPPCVFPSHFGPNSFTMHRSEAARVGATTTIVENSRLALDIDEAADLAAFLRVGQGTRTHNLLVELGVPHRLQGAGAIHPARP